MRIAKNSLVALLALLVLFVAAHGVRLHKQQHGRQHRQLDAEASSVSPYVLNLLEQSLLHQTADEEDGPLNMRVFDITDDKLCQPLDNDKSGKALTKAEFCREVVTGQPLCTPDIDEINLEDAFKRLDHDAMGRYLEWVEGLPPANRTDVKVRALVKKYACLSAGFLPKPTGRGECSVIAELASIGVLTKTSPLVQMTAEGTPLPLAKDDNQFFFYLTTTSSGDNPECPQVPVNPPDGYNVMLKDPDELPTVRELSPEELGHLTKMAEDMQKFMKTGVQRSQRSELTRTDQQKMIPKPVNNVETQNKDLIATLMKALETTNLADFITNALKGQGTTGVDPHSELNNNGKNERGEENNPNLGNIQPNNGAPTKEVVVAQPTPKKSALVHNTMFAELSAKVSSKEKYNVVAFAWVPHDQIIQQAAALVIPGFKYDGVFWRGTKYPDVPEAKNQYVGEAVYGGRHVAPKAWYKDIANVVFDGVVGKLGNCAKLVKAHNVKSKIRYNWRNCMNWKVNFREQPWHSSATPMRLMKTDKVDAVNEFEDVDGTRQEQIDSSMSGLKYQATVNNRQARHLAVGAILRWVDDCLVAIHQSNNENDVIEAIKHKCREDERDNTAACKCKSLLGHAMHTIADSFPPSHTHRALLRADQDECFLEDLPNYTIENFYSVDVQDPFRHKLADDVYEDGFAKCAIQASAGLLNIVFDVRHSLYNRLHLARDFLCDSVYPVRAEKLDMPAGGAPASLAGNFMVQKPTQVVRVSGDDKVARTQVATAAWTLNDNHLGNDPNVGLIFNPWREEYEAQLNNPPQPDPALVARDYHPEFDADVPYDDLALEKIWNNQDVCA